MNNSNDYNSNDIIYVKLTKLGYILLRTYYKGPSIELRNKFPEIAKLWIDNMPKEDPAGFLEFKIYDFMNIFGDYLNAGREDYPIEDFFELTKEKGLVNNIIIKKKVGIKVINKKQILEIYDMMINGLFYEGERYSFTIIDLIDYLEKNDNTLSEFVKQLECSIKNDVCFSKIEMIRRNEDDDLIINNYIDDLNKKYRNTDNIISFSNTPSVCVIRINEEKRFILNEIYNMLNEKNIVTEEDIRDCFISDNGNDNNFSEDDIAFINSELKDAGLPQNKSSITACLERKKLEAPLRLMKNKKTEVYFR